MPKFAFRVVAELDDSYTSFPPRPSDTKITDLDIMNYLNDYRDMLRTRDTADKVERLVILIVGCDIDDAYEEYLDPYKFWPIPETSFHSELRDICRR